MTFTKMLQRNDVVEVLKVEFKTRSKRNLNELDASCICIEQGKRLQIYRFLSKAFHYFMFFLSEYYSGIKQERIKF